MPRLSFEIEAEDRGSAEVDKLGRNVNELDRDIDELSRGLREEARAADQSERSTRGLGLAMGGTLAAVGGLAAGFVALTRQQAEYHRLVERSAFVSNRSQQDVEALIRTFEQYGIAIDSTEDALRTFYDRLGDARADPNIEAAQIFRQVGLEIDDADVRLEDFLERLQSFDRQSQIFIVETVLGGEGAAILQAASQAGFRGQVEANLTLTLDPEDRQAILEADQQIERATQELGVSIDRLIASNSGLIEGFISGASDFLTGASEIADSLPIVGQNIASAIGDLSRGQFFAPTRRGAGGQAATSSADFFRPRAAAAGTPAATGRQRLQVTDDSTPQADPYSLDAFDDAMLGLSERDLEAIARFDAELGSPDAVRRGGLGRSGFIAAPSASPEEVRSQTEQFGSMADDLSAIHFELAEFLPEIANNTLNALGAAAQFAVQPNVVSLVQAGIASARALAELLDLNRPQPVGFSTVGEFEFTGEDDAAAQATQMISTGVVNPLTGEILTPEQLALAQASIEDFAALLPLLLGTSFDQVQDSAEDFWQNLNDQPLTAEERLEQLAGYIGEQFPESWNAFERRAFEAWDAFRNGGDLSQEQMLLFDTYVNTVLLPTIDQMEGQFVTSFDEIINSEASAEEKFQALGDFIKTDLDEAALGLADSFTNSFGLSALSGDAFFDSLDDGLLNGSINLEALRAAIALVGDNTLAAGTLVSAIFGDEFGTHLGSAEENAEALAAALGEDGFSGDLDSIKSLIADVFTTQFATQTGAAKKSIAGIGLQTANTANVIQQIVNNIIAQSFGKVGSTAEAAGKIATDQLGTEIPTAAQIAAKALSGAGSLAVAFVQSGNAAEDSLNAVNRDLGTTIGNTLTARETVNSLGRAIDALPEGKTITITILEEHVGVTAIEEVGDSTPTSSGRFMGDPFAGDPFGRSNPFANDPFNRPGRRVGFQDGGRFLVDRPSYFLAGEAGRELVQITPENAQAPEGGREPVQVQVNISAVDAQSIEELMRGSGRDAIVEVIRDATSNGEAVVSTRGLVNDEVF